MAKVRPSSTRFEAEVEILLRAQMAGFRSGLGADPDDLQRQEEPLPADPRQRTVPEDDVAHLAGPVTGKFD